MGYGLSIQRNDRENLGRIWLYTDFSWSGNQGDVDCYSDTDFLDHFPTEPEARASLREQLQLSVKAAKKATNASFGETLKGFELRL
jgi:hypothetical protein